MSLRAKTASFIVACMFALAPQLATAAPRQPTAADIDKLRATKAALAETVLEKLGGSRILFKVDAGALREAIVTDLRDDVYRIVREDRIPFAGLTVREGGVELKIADGKNRDRLLGKLMPSAEAAPWSAATLGVADKGDGLIRLAPTDAGFTGRLHRLVEDSMNMIEQRLHDGGIREVGLRPEGADGIRVLLPGVADPQAATTIFSQKTRVAFRLVDLSMTAEDALRGSPPPASEVLYGFKDKTPYLVLKESVLDGDDIAYAAPSFGPNEQPVVSFRFNARGTRRFTHITQDNAGRPFAVVVNDKVFSAPVIREPIVNGSGQISGNFTLEEANSVAMLLLSGTLPRRLNVVEQQVVASSGHAGKQ